VGAYAVAAAQVCFLNVSYFVSFQDGNGHHREIGGLTGRSLYAN
jgi:hypothetical protein